MTTTAKHTPGPWKHDGYERVRPVAGKQDGTNDICHVYQHHKESMDNTRLIAAAPDLLAACKAYLYGQKEGRECEAMMRDAIAKAEPT